MSNLPIVFSFALVAALDTWSLGLGDCRLAHEPLLPSALGATQLSFGQVSPFMHPYTKDPGMAQSGSDAPHWQSQPSFAFQYDGEHVHSEGGTLPEGVASYCPFGASPITYSLEVGAVPMTACRSRLRPKLVLPDLRLFALPLFGS